MHPQTLHSAHTRLTPRRLEMTAFVISCAVLNVVILMKSVCCGAVRESTDCNRGKGSILGWLRSVDISFLCSQWINRAKTRCRMNIWLYCAIFSTNLFFLFLYLLICHIRSPISVTVTSFPNFTNFICRCSCFLIATRIKMSWMQT